MGLISTTLSIYKKNQTDIVEALKAELKEKKGLPKFKRIEVINDNFFEKLETDVFTDPGAHYLVGERFNNWTTILELNVDLEEPLYLTELGLGISARLQTYCLSFNLYDGEVLFYDLFLNGTLVDGYSSNVQYFDEEPLTRDKILAQRHTVTLLSKLLPPGKTVDKLNEILDRGYWKAFDNNDLGKDGLPDEEKFYEVDEEQRLKELACYIELYDAFNFPYGSWYEDIFKLDLSRAYVLKAGK